MSLRIHIERVVLEGLEMSPSERRKFTRALEATLSRLFAAGSISDELLSERRVASLGPVDVRLSAGSESPRLASELASGVYRGLAPPAPAAAAPGGILGLSRGSSP